MRGYCLFYLEVLMVIHWWFCFLKMCAFLNGIYNFNDFHRFLTYFTSRLNKGLLEGVLIG